MFSCLLAPPQEGSPSEARHRRRPSHPKGKGEVEMTPLQYQVAKDRKERMRSIREKQASTLRLARLRAEHKDKVTGRRDLMLESMVALGVV